MRRSFLVAFSLTLVTLVIVLLAALFFDLRARQTLQQRLAAVRDEAETVSMAATQTADSFVIAQATRQATADALATAEADAVLLEGQLVEARREANELSGQLDTLSNNLAEANEALAQMEQEQAATLSQFPLVAIVAPEDGAELEPDQPVDVIVAASDTRGITAVNLTIDGQTTSYDVADRTLFVGIETWTPPALGEFEIRAMATNVEGLSSDPVTRTVQVVDVEAANAMLQAQIEANVSAIRGLTAVTPITTTSLTREGLRERVEVDFAADMTLEEAQKEVLVLSTFDFMPRTFDLYNTLVDIHSEQVLGFYDPETAEFVVINDDAVLDANEQWTYAHEFVHVLQDQHFSLAQLGDAEALHSEERAALRALAEGEATLVQFLYLRDGYFSPEEEREILTALGNAPGLASGAPSILTSDLAFPYQQGFEFVLTLYQEGGFAAIDAAWADLPRSSEHILHPDRYLNGDEPQIVNLPPLTDTLGAGWRLLEEDMLGEFYLRQYLGQQVDRSVVETAATGWGGDRYAVYWNEAEDHLALALRLAWDSAADRDEFVAAYEQYPAALYGRSGAGQPDGSTCWQEQDAICLYEVAEDALIVRAPDVATATALGTAVIADVP